jgi:hypothetical protein
MIQRLSENDKGDRHENQSQADCNPAIARTWGENRDGYRLAPSAGRLLMGSRGHGTAVGLLAM